MAAPNLGQVYAETDAPEEPPGEGCEIVKCFEADSGPFLFRLPQRDEVAAGFAVRCHPQDLQRGFAN